MIFKLKPALKSAIWGGTRLKTEFGFNSDNDHVAEAWVLSCHKNGQSIVDGGPYDGMPLGTLIQTLGKGCLGAHGAAFSDFPILIKLIDAADDLSVQVHPDDAYALQNEGQFGKTEMWYFISCEPDAGIYYGCAAPLSKADFERYIQNGTLTAHLHYQKTRPGDAVFIPAGTVHSICKGNLIAEIQQNSDVTYRIFDYDRRDQNGNPRQLHIKQALDVAKLSPPETYDFGDHVAACPIFTVDRLAVLTSKTLEADAQSFHSILVLSGSGTIQNKDATVAYQKGDSLFIPAGSGAYQISGVLDGLLTTI